MALEGLLLGPLGVGCVPRKGCRVTYVEQRKRLGRPPVGAAARTRMLRARITEEGGAILDRMRGETSESEFIRWLIAQEFKRRGGK
jgi:hypothetical protein